MNENRRRIVEPGGGVMVEWSFLLGGFVDAVARFVLRGLDLDALLLTGDGNETPDAVGLASRWPS